MKIQELAIIFIIIILPISLLLSEYTQYQIKTINLQTEYDAKLTAATYDAIRAFQLNAINSTTSSLSNSKMRDIEASVNSFRKSIMAGFELNGYTKEDLDNYIPALVYTLYDGFYLYSPYENVNHRYLDTATNKSITKLKATASDVKADDNGERLYGLKPYINYSCRYKYGSSTDVIITYALDNHVTVQGMVDNKYVNESGYLIDNIKITGDDITYNGVKIEKEHLKEKIGNQLYSYVKIGGTKYYLMENYSENKDCIVYFLNGKPTIQYKQGDTQFISWKDMILNNNNAIQFYKDAEKFTKWFKSTSLKELKYSDAYDEVILNNGNDNSTIEIDKVWPSDSRKIFVFNSNADNTSKNIENELSEFNQHRLEVIRHKIETNLAVAISNYNDYSNSDNVFQMPELKEDEWNQIIHNISLISFLQGLPIGGKIYNGYSIVTNSESKEVVLEEYIYILGDDNNYHKIGDKKFESNAGVNKIEVSAGEYIGDVNNSNNEKVVSAGRINLDFEKNLILSNDSTSSYYYPLNDYNASYDSVVMQNNVTTYDDIYAYVNDCGNDDLKKAFYTALGRERYSMYKSSDKTVEYYSVLILGHISPSTSASPETYKEKIRKIINELSEEKEIKATYVFSQDYNVLNECIQKELIDSTNYNLVIAHSFVWPSGIDASLINQVSNKTNLITIGNDVSNLEIMNAIGTTDTKVTPIQTDLGKSKFGNILINTSGMSDNQAAFKFRNGVDVFYEGTYSGGGLNGKYDLIGCWEKGKYRWLHSQVSLDNLDDNGHKKLLKELVKYALDID